MQWLAVQEVARKWGVTEQTIRHYCREGYIDGAVMNGRIWYIPPSAQPPVFDEWKALPPPLLQKLIIQKDSTYRGLYNYLQINMAYSSSRLASNRLTRNHVEYLFKKGKLLVTNELMKLNDYIEVRNHFLCLNHILEECMKPLKPSLVTDLHSKLFSDICGHKLCPVKCGEFRIADAPSKAGYNVPPTEIKNYLLLLFKRYETLEEVTLFDILDLHVSFENIRPFENGNGRIGRLLLLKECLRHNLMPFIIDDKRRFEYIKGIRDWDEDPSLLLAVCKDCQARFEAQIEVQKLLSCHARIMRQIRRE